MESFQSVFKRYEKKYLVSAEQASSLMKCLLKHMRADDYGRTTICSVYMDTPDFQLIRTSLEKPVYKEKLRLRTYGVPAAESPAYVEIKKKYKGVVYKRRISTAYALAEAWLFHGLCVPTQGQIESEIAWFLKSYENIAPAASICYDRVALYGLEDPQLRVTLDENIRYRTRDLSLFCGSGGELLTAPGERLMEIKVAGGMPLWLAEALSELQIYPTSFSKYGNAYKAMMEKKEAVQIA